ncbi:MAG TPA: hypothetical protein VIC06_09730 [Solirubrobacteraceae bacterium]
MRRSASVATTVAVLLCALTCVGGSASAAAPGAGWALTARTSPTNLPPGGEGTVLVSALNVGEAPSSGPVLVTDTLPTGVTAIEAGERVNIGFGHQGLAEIGHSLWDCTGNGSGGPPGVAGATIVTCTNNLEGMPSIAGGAGAFTGPGFEGPNLDPEIAITVNLPTAPVSEPNRVTIAGGGAQESASAANPIAVSSTSPPFGLTGWNVWLSNADGTPDTQAGSHPYAATVKIALANVYSPEEESNQPAGGQPRNFVIGLPAGFTGDPNAVAKCTRQQLDGQHCPDASQVGTAVAWAGNSGLTRFQVYNIVPPAGAPAELGFTVEAIETRIDSSVRSGGDYGLTEHADDIPERGVQEVTTTLWGVPGDPSHDIWRTTRLGGCSRESIETHECPSSSVNATSGAFLTLPSACAGAAVFSLGANSWFDLTSALESEMSTSSQNGSGDPLGFSGCARLPFMPSLSVAPETGRADTPTGLTVDVRMPNQGLSEPGQLASADLRDSTVVLPEGLVVNPGQATGLVACQPGQDAIGTEAAAACPAASRLGSARIVVPALSEPLEGSVYVLQSNPPDIRLLVAASGDGVNVKVPGTVHLDAASGRLTATFQEIPQQPVTDIKLVFNGGPQAALTTPRVCGAFTTTSDFTPWSRPFAADAFPTSQFTIGEGVGGGACPAGEPFAPSAVAGMSNNQAGGFSPFSATFSRQDSEQDVSAMSITTPPGLLAILKGVELCGEPQASLGTCGQGSLIGHITVDVGAGPDPLVVQGGQVFLTGPYKGAPFGLSVVVPAAAGPFNLGNVVVRAAIGVDSHTARITVTSDPLPRILDGVPLQLKTVNVSIDRPGFIFNPTNCEALSVNGTLTSTQEATAGVSSRFQAANCAALAFKPSFKVFTQAKTSKKGGASLDVKVGYPSGAQANIRAVAVTLPKALPSRLTTIQQACPEATFAANPASCPAGSNIGAATASTPVFANPLTGPAYLVSHGGAAFPDLVIVLQGEGVTLDLIGSISIKKGVTSSAFDSVPDAPISSFELSLPAGPHSALAAVLPAKAKGSLCGTSLTMPTTITGQNGAQVKQNTKIAVTGCAKANTRRAHGKKAKAGKHRKTKKRK